MTVIKNVFSTEDEIIRACIKQDPLAQRALYESYSPVMLALCTRYMGGKDRARDALHDGFITVFEKIGSYNGAGSFEGWMKRIFVNTALMSIRKGDVLKFSDELNTVDREHAVDASVLSSISSSELMALVSSMPDGFRAVFNMYAIEGFTHQEIAEELKISESSSRSQFSRARIWLQERLKDFKR